MLLKTRFYLPPLRSNSIIRKPLIERLSSTAGGDLIVVSAPPGYGKTTLLSQWLHQVPHIFAWVVLDSSQSNPLLFWEYVINAINGAQPGIGEDAKHQLKENRPDIAKVIISLLNDLDSFSTLNSASPLTLVLDDFHKLTDIETFQTFNLFLDHLPSAIRIAITTRSEPPLNLSRRRANQQLLDIGVDDLAFSPHDAQDFFVNTMGLSVTNDQVQTILAKIEGWAAGLQLVALSLQRNQQHPDRLLEIDKQQPGEDKLIRDISDYLFDEVFSIQTKDIKTFLVKTACPSRFCASLANVVIDRDDSFNKLKEIDQLNLFLVPLDNHRTWFRYHDSFRQFLLQRFSELPSEEQENVERKALGWLEQGGYANISVYRQNALIERESKCISGVQPEPLSIEPLTKREMQVMAYLKEGFSNKEIAERLNISLNTLKVHIRNLYGKIGVENRSQALVKMTKAES